MKVHASLTASHTSSALSSQRHMSLMTKISLTAIAAVGTTFLIMSLAMPPLVFVAIPFFAGAAFLTYRERRRYLIVTQPILNPAGRVIPGVRVADPIVVQNVVHVPQSPRPIVIHPAQPTQSILRPLPSPTRTIVVAPSGNIVPNIRPTVARPLPSQRETVIIASGNAVPSLNIRPNVARPLPSQQATVVAPSGNIVPGVRGRPLRQQRSMQPSQVQPFQVNQRSAFHPVVPVVTVPARVIVSQAASLPRNVNASRPPISRPIVPARVAPVPLTLIRPAVVSTQTRVARASSAATLANVVNLSSSMNNAAVVPSGRVLPGTRRR